MKLRLTRGLAIAMLLFAQAGCEQLTATVQGASVLTRTPRINEVEGLPSSLIDAVSDAAGGAELGTVIALAAISERDGVTDTRAPDPLSGAQVTLEGPNARIGLCELTTTAPGTYRVTTQPATGCDGTRLEYVVGAKYVTAVETSSERYTLTIDAAPAPVEDVRFSPGFGMGGLGGVPLHSTGTPLTIDWGENPDELDGFVTVFRLDFVGDPSVAADVVSSSSWQAAPTNPIFDNFPRTGGEALQLVLGDPVSSVTVPGEVLSATGLYIAVVTATEISDRVSSNLTLGSSALAGAGRAWAFWVD